MCYQLFHSVQLHTISAIKLSRFLHFEFKKNEENRKQKTFTPAIYYSLCTLCSRFDVIYILRNHDEEGTDLKCIQWRTSIHSMEYGVRHTISRCILCSSKTFIHNKIIGQGCLVRALVHTFELYSI